MKILLTILIILCISTPAFAVSVADAVKWAYPDCDFMTVQENPDDASQNPKMVIKDWRCSEPQPTKDEINQIKIEYKAAKDIEKAERKSRKQALATKLNLSKQEVKALIEIVEDKSED